MADRTLEPYRDQKLPERFQRWIEVLRQKIATYPCYLQGEGTPEALISAGLCDLYCDELTGTLYVKGSATGNTGWVAVGGSGITLTPGASDADFASVQLLAPFDGIDGASSETDKSNFGRALTFVGSPVLSDTVAFFGVTSLLLTGGQYVTVPNSAALIPDVAYTIEANIQIRSAGKGLGNTHSIIGNRTAGPQNGFQLRVGTTNQLAFFGYASGGATPVINLVGTTALLADTPYHVQASRDALGNWDITLDGVLEATGLETAAITNTGNALHIGRDITNGTRDLDGFIGNVRMTRTVDRYPVTPFVPPAAKFAESLADLAAFQVGDLAQTIPLELHGSEILVPTSVLKPSYFNLPRFTTAQLADISNAVNTTIRKEGGSMVWNSTTGRPVWAFGPADGDVWVDATGATAHTPV